MKKTYIATFSILILSVSSTNVLAWKCGQSCPSSIFSGKLECEAYQLLPACTLKGAEDGSKYRFGDTNFPSAPSSKMKGEQAKESGKADVPAPSLEYLGCYKDQGDSSDTQGRDLNGYLIESNDMTPSKCVRICADQAFNYAGVQYGSQCFCGMSYGSFGSANNCDYQCAGDSSSKCGGFWVNSIYTAGWEHSSYSGN